MDTGGGPVVQQVIYKRTLTLSEHGGSVMLSFYAKDGGGSHIQRSIEHSSDEIKAAVAAWLDGEDRFKP